MNVFRRLVVLISLLVLAAQFLARPTLAAPHPVIVCYGDSITAGYGLEFGESYPDLLQQKLNSHGYRYQVKNQGANGTTTKDALAGIQSILRMHPEIVIPNSSATTPSSAFPPIKPARIWKPS